MADGYTAEISAVDHVAQEGLHFFARDSIYAKRAYAIAIPSVRPSVRLSVRLSHG